MLFALVAKDKPNGLADRMAARPDHLVHLKALGDHLKLAGAFLDGAGDMAGSLVLIDAADLAEAEGLLARDPYVQRGVFESHELRPLRVAINNMGD